MLIPFFGLPRCLCKFILLVAVVAPLTSGCVSIPTRNFDAYRSSFAAAKTATEDIVLRGKIAAKALAEDPANPQPAAERLAKLKERDQAANERLLALETIDRYNTVLVQLAEGKNPKNVKSSLESFSNSLLQIGSSRITEAVQKAVPYAGIAAEIIAMADEATNRREFLNLVTKGGEPVREIIGILIADADDIDKIVSEQMAVPRDLSDNRLSGLRFQFLNVADELQVATEITGVIKQMNDARATLVHQKLPEVKPRVGVRTPGHTDLAMLKMLVDSTKNEIAIANAITSRIKSQHEVIVEYKKLLNQTRMSLLQLEKTIKYNRPVATADFINRALGLREATLKLREGV
ncbi:hypothetical protein [Geobacter sp. DSM 9736]|uniref:hypothetical protein n=1 Tax=Geobacter sp. DSM 9736 TaxID=1277350 RepID=UPI000B50FEE6|nr:hypothetical protein [Geobacter sp. DSM 9736]SNB45461.1 hypothetical protein SAMN06269301_0875 [Geobacter sp. DSM 9736]